MRVPDELRDGPGVIAVTELRESSKKISISGTRLDRLVGSYEFDAGYVPSLEEVISKCRFKGSQSTKEFGFIQR